MKNDLASLISDNEQDRAACAEWWANASLEAKQRVWDAIQIIHDDPAMEIVSCLAQVAFGAMVEKEFKDARKSAVKSLVRELTKAMGPCFVCGERIRAKQLAKGEGGRYRHANCEPAAEEKRS